MTKLRDWAVGQAGESGYSQAALSLNDWKPPFWNKRCWELCHGLTSSSRTYEGGLSISLSAIISLQPLGVGHATIPHIKAVDVSFHLIYGSLISAKRFQSDRQNKEGCSQTPGGHQNMIIKYLSVGQWTWFLYQQVALNLLFQMRYNSILNSKKHPNDGQRSGTPPVFTPI